MKIEIPTANPNLLWETIKKDIADEKIKTWSVVLNKENKERLTHNPKQWMNKALLKPSVLSNPNRLVFTVTWFTDSVPSEYIKGLYIGRFTEELLEHYKDKFVKLETFG